MPVETTTTTRCDGCEKEIAPDVPLPVVLRDLTSTIVEARFHSYLCVVPWAAGRNDVHQAQLRTHLQSCVEQTAQNAADARAQADEALAVVYDVQSVDAAAMVDAFEVKAADQSGIAAQIADVAAAIVATVPADEVKP